MNRAWSKYHLECPYCNKKIKVHIIFKKESGIETVTERADLNLHEIYIRNKEGVSVKKPNE